MLTVWKFQDFLSLRFYVKSLSTVWKKGKFFSHLKIFCEINSVVTSIIDTLLSRIFRQKSVRVNFHNFYTVSSACGIVLSRLLDENSVKSIFSITTLYTELLFKVEFHEITGLRTVMWWLVNSIFTFFKKNNFVTSTEIM